MFTLILTVLNRDYIGGGGGGYYNPYQGLVSIRGNIPRRTVSGLEFGEPKCVSMDFQDLWGLGGLEG